MLRQRTEAIQEGAIVTDSDEAKSVVAKHVQLSRPMQAVSINTQGASGRVNRPRSWACRRPAARCAGASGSLQSTYYGVDELLCPPREITESFDNDGCWGSDFTPSSKLFASSVLRYRAELRDTYRGVPFH